MPLAETSNLPHLGMAIRAATRRGPRPGWPSAKAASLSSTCPIFSDRVPRMERLAREHVTAAFLVIVVREAHLGELSPPHRTAAEKRSAARRRAMEEGLGRRVLVDDLEGTVHRTYGGAWDAVYVVDTEGRVAFRRAWNHLDEVAAAPAALQGSSTAPRVRRSKWRNSPAGRPSGFVCWSGAVARPFSISTEALQTQYAVGSRNHRRPLGK